MPSVPNSSSYEFLKKELVAILELTLEIKDREMTARAFQLARLFYEQSVKPAAHKGKISWSQANAMGALLDKIERRRQSQ